MWPLCLAIESWFWCCLIDLIPNGIYKYSTEWLVCFVWFGSNTASFVNRNDFLNNNLRSFYACGETQMANGLLVENLIGCASDVCCSSIHEKIFNEPFNELHFHNHKEASKISSWEGNKTQPCAFKNFRILWAEKKMLHLLNADAKVFRKLQPFPFEFVRIHAAHSHSLIASYFLNLCSVRWFIRMQILIIFFFSLHLPVLTV